MLEGEPEQELKSKRGGGGDQRGFLKILGKPLKKFLPKKPFCWAKK